MHRTCITLRDRKQGLPDHAVQHLLRHLGVIAVLNGRQLGVFDGGDAHDREFRLARENDRVELVVHPHLDCVLRQTAHNVAEQLGGQHQLARGFDLCGDFGRDAQLHVVARQKQRARPRAQKDALQSAEGGFCADGAADIVDRLEKLLPVAKKMHNRSSFRID